MADIKTGNVTNVVQNLCGRNPFNELEGCKDPDGAIQLLAEQAIVECKDDTYENCPVRKVRIATTDGAKIQVALENLSNKATTADEKLRNRALALLKALAEEKKEETPAPTGDAASDYIDETDWKAFLKGCKKAGNTSADCKEEGASLGVVGAPIVAPAGDGNGGGSGGGGGGGGTSNIDSGVHFSLGVVGRYSIGGQIGNTDPRDKIPTSAGGVTLGGTTIGDVGLGGGMETQPQALSSADGASNPAGLPKNTEFGPSIGVEGRGTYISENGAYATVAVGYQKTRTSTPGGIRNFESSNLDSLSVEVGAGVFIDSSKVGAGVSLSSSRTDGDREIVAGQGFGAKEYAFLDPEMMSAELFLEGGYMVTVSIELFARAGSKFRLDRERPANNESTNTWFGPVADLTLEFGGRFYFDSLFE